MGLLNNGALRGAAACFALVSIAGCVAASPVASQKAAVPSQKAPVATVTVAGASTRASAPIAASPVELRGTYTFEMRVDADGTCGWPVKTFLWPVSIDRPSSVTSNVRIVFPPTPAAPRNEWTIRASVTGTELVPAQGSPGRAAAAYDLVASGGNWQAGPATRGHDGRSEITSGTASGAKFTLVLPGSDRRWECGSDATWSLLTRHVDLD